MGRVCFYSDDSYKAVSAVRFSFVVAGVALDHVKDEAEAWLLDAESGSGKGCRDWHSIKDVSIRRRYIEAVLNSRDLTGRVFYGSWGALEPSEFWDARVLVLGEAVRHYSHRARCHHEVSHEGLKLKPRQQLRAQLKHRGIKRLTVEPGVLAASPQIRCADALAGYIRGKLFDGGAAAAELPPLPGWLVDLSPARSPVQTKAP